MKNALEKALRFGVDEISCDVGYRLVTQLLRYQSSRLRGLELWGEIILTNK